MLSGYKLRVQARLLVFAVMLAGFAGCAGATYDTHDDLTISTHVKIVLLDDVQLGGYRLNASTLRGVVTLQGSVPTHADVDRAIAVARKVSGVKEVKSEIKIDSQLLAPRFSPTAPRSSPHALTSFPS